MTEAQKEYIITGDELIRATKFLVVHGMAPLKSRPYKSDAVLDKCRPKKREKKSDNEWEDDERNCDSSHSLVHDAMMSSIGRSR
jgi:hypothetical protein